MVDRIVPATTEADRAAVAAVLGLDDAWPVVAEPYARWVIEDHFPHGRPALHLSGAEIVADVAPSEHMKLRMLNGAHSAIAAIGQIAGLATVADTYADARVRGFVDRFWQQMNPTLSPAVDGTAYVAGLRARFANPALQHETVQIASDASQKVPQRILAGLAELLDAGRPVDAVLLALALWVRSCGATDDRGAPITVNDPAFAAWTAPDQTALPPHTVIDAFLGFAPVFGPGWRIRPGFAAALTAAYAALRDHGALGALAPLPEARC